MGVLALVKEREGEDGQTTNALILDVSRVVRAEFWIGPKEIPTLGVVFDGDVVTHGKDGVVGYLEFEGDTARDLLEILKSACQLAAPGIVARQKAKVERRITTPGELLTGRKG